MAYLSTCFMDVLFYIKYAALFNFQYLYPYISMMIIICGQDIPPSNGANYCDDVYV